MILLSLVCIILADGTFANSPPMAGNCAEAYFFCDDLANCVEDNAAFTFTCDCQIGSSGDGLKASGSSGCTPDVTPCESDRDCHPDGLCSPTFTCECKPLYRGDGSTKCSDIDECLSSPCNVNANCRNNVGAAHECNCKPGFAGDGVTECKHVKAAKLTITPTQNLQAGSTSLTIRCSPDSNSNYTKLLTMAIYRTTTASPSMPRMMAIGYSSMITTRYSSGTLTRGSGITTPKYDIDLHVDTIPTNSFLRVIINHPDCHDSGEYLCATTGETATLSGPGYLVDSKPVTVQSNPSTVEIKIFPQKMKYDVGEQIEITCQTRVENPEITWTWESESPAGSSSIASTENIRTTQVDPQTSTQCGYNTGSTLQHIVTMEDDGLKIRCKVDNSELSSAIKAIYLTLDDVKKRMLLADTERIKLEQDKLKQQISSLSRNTTNCNCCN